MTHEEAVQLLDESATLRDSITWEGERGFFVIGSNWETPMVDTPDRAWELAVYKAASLPVPEVL